MGLGPAICRQCFVTGKWSTIHKEIRCPSCNSVPAGYLFQMTDAGKDLVDIRTYLHDCSRDEQFMITEDFPIKISIEVSTKIRMIEHMAWLQRNIGKEGLDWRWDFKNRDISSVELKFLDTEDAVCFKLANNVSCN